MCFVRASGGRGESNIDYIQIELELFYSIPSLSTKSLNNYYPVARGLHLADDDAMLLFQYGVSDYISTINFNRYSKN